MKEGWKYVKLGEVCEIIGGGTPSKKVPEFYSGNIPWATVGDMNVEKLFQTELYITQEAIKNSSTNIIKQGEIIIATRVGLGKTCILMQDTAINQDLKGIVPKKNNINRKYLFFWFQSIAQYIISNGVGATVQGVKVSFVSNITFPLPPLPEQEEIVRYLDSAFEKIDAMKEKAEEALEEAKVLFQSALTEMLTPKKSWEYVKLGEVATIIHGKNQKEVLSENGQYPIYGSGGTIMGYATDYLCEAGTTILGRKGTINNPQIIPHRFWNVDTAFGIAANEKIDKKLLYYFVKSQDWSKKNSGTTLPSLTQTIVAETPIPLPPLPEQEAIVSRLDAISERVKALEENYSKAVEECDAMKQAILRKVFE